MRAITLEQAELVSGGMDRLPASAAVLHPRGTDQELVVIFWTDGSASSYTRDPAPTPPSIGPA